MLTHFKRVKASTEGEVLREKDKKSVLPEELTQRLVTRPMAVRQAIMGGYKVAPADATAAPVKPKGLNLSVARANGNGTGNTTCFHPKVATPAPTLNSLKRVRSEAEDR